MLRFFVDLRSLVVALSRRLRFITPPSSKCRDQDGDKANAQAMFNLANNLKAAGRNADAVDM